jgi:hypothetical protein
MTHFDWTFRPADVVAMSTAICTVVWIVGRLFMSRIASWVKSVDERLNLHEGALEQAGWLKRNRDGKLEISEHRGV